VTRAEPPVLQAARTAGAREGRRPGFFGTSWGLARGACCREAEDFHRQSWRWRCRRARAGPGSSSHCRCRGRATSDDVAGSGGPSMANPRLLGDSPQPCSRSPTRPWRGPASERRACLRRGARSCSGASLCGGSSAANAGTRGASGRVVKIAIEADPDEASHKREAGCGQFALSMERRIGEPVADAASARWHSPGQSQGGVGELNAHRFQLRQYRRFTPQRFHLMATYRSHGR
jgi:hypothetical protein